MRYLPDDILESYQDLTPDRLTALGIKALIVDIDNTLIPYEECTPREGTEAWIKSFQNAGIGIAFVTNNHKSRLEQFNQTLGLPAFYHSCKPLSRNMKRAMKALGAKRQETANIGDQFFTDTLAGKRLGLVSFLVPPIRDKRGWFTRLKRQFEKLFLRAFYHQKLKEKDRKA